MKAMILFTALLLIQGTFGQFGGGGHGDCQFASASLSTPRAGLVGVQAGGNVLFAGGYYLNNGKKVYTTSVDVFDYTNPAAPSSSKSVSLPEAREGLTATAVGTAAAFTGGKDADGHGTNTVWIYNTASDEWAKVALPNGVVGYGQSTVKQAVDMEVFLAGGYYYEDMENMDLSVPAAEGDYSYSAMVAMYDLSSEQWNIQALTRARAEMGAVELGDYAYLAGGVNSNGVQGLIERVHLGYEEQVTIVGELEERRRDLAGASISWNDENLLFFGGGFGSNGASAKVEIFNATTDGSISTFATGELAAARGGLTATTIDDIVMFGPGIDASGNTVGVIDVYNVTAGTWFNYTMSDPRAGAAVVSMPPDTFYVAGGMTSSGAASDSCDLLDCISTWPDDTPAPTPVPWPDCTPSPSYNPETDGCEQGDAWCQLENGFSYCKWWSGGGTAKYPMCWKTAQLCSCQCGPAQNNLFEPIEEEKTQKPAGHHLIKKMTQKVDKSWEQEKLKVVSI